MEGERHRGHDCSQEGGKKINKGMKREDWRLPWCCVETYFSFSCPDSKYLAFFFVPLSGAPDLNL